MKNKIIIFSTIFIMFLLIMTSCTKKTYIVSFDTDGGTEIQDQNVVKKKTVSKPNDPKKEGHTFIGWYVDNNEFDFNTKITNHLVIKAKWEINEYTVSFTTNTSEHLDSIKVTYNELVPSVKELTKIGHTFNGWYLDDELYDFNTPVTKDITLEAKWDLIKFVINLDGNGSILENSFIQFDYDNFPTLPTPTKEGYNFLGWYDGDKKIENIENKNYNLVAKWEQISYEVSFVTDCDQTIPNQTILYNNSVMKPEDLTKEGHIFLGWYLNDELYDFNNIVTSDIEIVAKWERKTYIVSFNTKIDVEIENVIVSYGDLLEEPTKLELKDHDFLGWFYKGKLYDFTKPVTSNLTLAANWEMTEDGVYNYLDSIIPEEATEKIQFYSGVDKCSAEFIWSSSNTEVISNYGNVVRMAYDVNVTITVLVLYSNYEYELEFNVLVPKITLKPYVKGKIVSGYLADYGSYGYLEDGVIDQLDYINYSFGYIVGGELSLPASLSPSKIMKYRSKGVRVGLAIGGWGADGFSQAVRTKESRTKFIKSIMKVIKQYQFDGIDIDWEYPGSGVAGIEYHSTDRYNLTLFCEELKKEMMLYRDDLILSIAIAPSNTYYDLTALNEYIDIFNVMTYDFAMGSTALHDSNLYAYSKSSNAMANSVEFVKKYVDADKIIPGAAFYVRRGYFASATNTQLGASLSIGMSTNPLGYDELVEMIKNDSSIVESYDYEAEAAYIIHKRWFYSYDNPQSIKAKCDYIKENGLAGIMCWDLTTDYINEEGKGELVNSMYANMK